MKALETEPFTQEEANRAAGMGSYKAPRKFEIKTQPDRPTMNQIFENKKDDMTII